MSQYFKCPNCGNSQKDTPIWQCTSCGFVGCAGGSFYGSGCYTSCCPKCQKGNSYKHIGYIS